MAEPVVLVLLNSLASVFCALPVARRFAELEKASLRILFVTEETIAPAQAAEQLGLEAADLRGATLEVRAGDAGEATLAAAAEHGAGLIVMCGQAAARAVLARAQSPVVLVNPEQPQTGWTLRHVLAPHDGSPAVSGALKPAAQCARTAGAELIVLHVADEERVLETGSFASPAYLDQVQHGWPLWSAEFLQRLGSICPLADVGVRLLVAHGDPAEETVRVAGEESADLIVLAWKGRWEAPHAPILKTLLRDAPCPVMVTRTAAA